MKDHASVKEGMWIETAIGVYEIVGIDENTIQVREVIFDVDYYNYALSPVKYEYVLEKE